MALATTAQVTKPIGTPIHTTYNDKFYHIDAPDQRLNDRDASMASQRGSVDSTPKPFRGPWEGENKIVIGIDIGTTQSGVAFAFLQQGTRIIFLLGTYLKRRWLHRKQSNPAPRHEMAWTGSSRPAKQNTQHHLVRH